MQVIQSWFNVILKTKTILLGLLCFHLCLPRPLPCPKLPQLPSIVFYWDQLLLGMYLCYGAMLFNPSQTLHPSSFTLHYKTKSIWYVGLPTPQCNGWSPGWTPLLSLFGCTTQGAPPLGFWWPFRPCTVPLLYPPVDLWFQRQGNHGGYGGHDPKTNRYQGQQLHSCPACLVRDSRLIETQILS